MAPDTSESFVARWKSVSGSERANYQLFITELCVLLGVPAPEPASEDTRDNAYVFERRVTFAHGDGTTSNGFIDCYRRGAFVLEAKKVRQGPTTKGFDDALLRARSQAESYARALPASEGRPPLLVVVDVGNVIELYAEFTRSGGNYTPFPDPRSHRIRLADLASPSIRERLRKAWLEPMELDPARASAAVTREVAAQLAEVAKSLEAAGHSPQHVAAFLTRCLFSMFAEDVELLPKGAFVELIEKHQAKPAVLRGMLKNLWTEMDKGGFSAALAENVRRFNGKLFKNAEGDAYALPLDRDQIGLLLRAAKANWREVEPAIFGTLLERALDPDERHALGAHYTPRAYVERLVLPTVVEPLRAEWRDAQAAAVLLAREAEELDGKARDAKRKEARAEIAKFHHRLCTVRVLDPACGSGNFLYVTLEHLKRLEGEVLNQLEALGPEGAGIQHRLGIEGETVTLQQLRGIEINERAAALAELVLWIGFLQWEIRTRGNDAVGEPVIHDYGNIECRDAVLAYDREEPALDSSTRKAITRWDGKTFKKHPVTGEDVPDEKAVVVQMRYVNPRKVDWPQADFIVGNPPFIGASGVRAALGDGYADALRSTWNDVPESADFVMHWWHHAAELVRANEASQFGFITTNSIRQSFNRRVLEYHLGAAAPLHLAFAIPDHPWVDVAQGAAVRIAMTVCKGGPGEGQLRTVIEERDTAHGEHDVTMTTRTGTIHANLRLGANVASARSLVACEGLSNRGVQLFGTGFIVTPVEAERLGLGRLRGLESHIRDYRNGRDLTGTSRGAMVIDAFGLTEDELRARFPTVYQWLVERVKPERDLNNRESRKRNWWLFGETNPKLREQLAGLPRYIVTVETAKHRAFQFLNESILPDNKLIAIALSDAWHLGVLTSHLHGEWALAAGGWLGVGNDPVYVKSRCFEAFPFPDNDTGLTPKLQARVRDLGEQIDAHRKRQQAAHDNLTLTGMYNVLEKLRTGAALTAKEKRIHEQGLVSVLRTLHDELDTAVLAAYGWSDLGPVPWRDDAAHERWIEELIERLVALNTKRAAEEAAFKRGEPGGRIRWLRPEFQDPAQRAPATKKQRQTEIDLDEAEPSKKLRKGKVAAKAAPSEKRAWPATLPEQMRAVADVLAGSSFAQDETAIASHFSGRGPWKNRLPQILQTLEALGRARRSPRGWHAV